MAVERLFLAALPDRQASAQLQRCATALRARFAAWRFVHPSRWHMTLLFCGQTEGGSPDCAQAATRALTTLQAPSMTLHLDWLQAFGNPRRPAVALVASRAPETLLQLREQLRAPLAASCPGMDQRPFQPHVALAYAAQRLQSALPMPAVPVDLTITRVALLRSVSGESSYRIVAARQLGTP